ncbi:hypothetical protein NRIC_26490 [Enterococcus florum]|uniref:YrhK domain-containing protein n=2 Tax=Enterococcus florum TaxID=2480627 RepID=A0A4P5PEY1_9ENTE|nr:hypothetical protein NRIC_26490 [Enterococcus florum]
MIRSVHIGRRIQLNLLSYSIALSHLDKERILKDMPKIKRKTHEVEKAIEEDIEIQGNRFRLYFQNRFSLISLIVDLLTGIFYIIGSIASLTPIPDVIGTYFYLAGAVFLTIRPVLRILKNIFIYDEMKIEKKKNR